MIDYLCLKLGWSTDQVLDNPHFDSQRKVALYRAMDNVERNRMVPAIPLGFDKKVSKQVSGAYSKAVAELNKLLKGGEVIEDKGDDIFDLFGSKENIEKFFRGVRDNKIPMKQIAKG